MIYTKNTIINFGKYKGQGTLGEVMNIDINYLCWCLSNVKYFKVSKNLKEEILDLGIENLSFKRDMDVEDSYMDGTLFPNY